MIEPPRVAGLDCGIMAALHLTGLDLILELAVFHERSNVAVRCVKARAVFGVCAPRKSLLLSRLLSRSGYPKEYSES